MKQMHHDIPDNPSHELLVVFPLNNTTIHYKLPKLVIPTSILKELPRLKCCRGPTCRTGQTPWRKSPPQTPWSPAAQSSAPAGSSARSASPRTCCTGTKRIQTGSRRDIKQDVCFEEKFTNSRPNSDPNSSLQNCIALCRLLLCCAHHGDTSGDIEGAFVWRP